jgi:Uma2 family endonuclease
MPAAARHRWTAEEVRNLQDEWRAWPRYELIDGELYATPSPGFLHQKAVRELVFALGPYLASQGIGDVLFSPADIELEPESVLQPDVFVFPPVEPEIEKPSWRDITSLLLAIEVISPSSARTDRVQKRGQYMRMAVDEYWVVDLEGRQVERWLRGRPGVEVARDALVWRPRGAVNALTIDLPALWKVIGKG